jgi:hypothetical protein
MIQPAPEGPVASRQRRDDLPSAGRHDGIEAGCEVGRARAVVGQPRDVADEDDIVEPVAVLIGDEDLHRILPDPEVIPVPLAELAGDRPVD